MEDYAQGTTCSDAGHALEGFYGQGLADSYLTRHDLGRPSKADISEWLKFVQTAVDDSNRPFERYGRQTIKELNEKAQIKGIVIAEDWNEYKDGGGKNQAYIFMRDNNALRKAPFSFLALLVKTYAKHASSPQLAHWGIASICLGCVDSEDNAFANIELYRQKKISEVAYSLHGEALNSLYIAAMAYKDAFSRTGKSRELAKDAVNRVDVSNAMWWGEGR